MEKALQRKMKTKNLENPPLKIHQRGLNSLRKAILDEIRAAPSPRHPHACERAWEATGKFSRMLTRV